MAAEIRDIFLQSKSIEWRENEKAGELSHKKANNKPSKPLEKIISIPSSFMSWVRGTFSSLNSQDQQIVNDPSPFPHPNTHHSNPTNRNTRENIYRNDNISHSSFLKQTSNEILSQDYKNKLLTENPTFTTAQANTSLPISHTYIYKIPEPEESTSSHYYPFRVREVSTTSEIASQIDTLPPINNLNQDSPNLNKRLPASPTRRSEYNDADQTRSINSEEVASQFSQQFSYTPSNISRHSIIDHLQDHNKKIKKSLQLGGVSIRTKRKFSDLKPRRSHRFIKDYQNSEIRSDIFPITQLIPPQNSTVSMMTSSKRARSMLEDPTDGQLLHGLTNLAKRKISSSASVYSASDIRSLHGSYIYNSRDNSSTTLLNIPHSPIRIPSNKLGISQNSKSNSGQALYDLHMDLSANLTVSHDLRTEFVPQRLSESFQSFLECFSIESTLPKSQNTSEYLNHEHLCIQNFQLSSLDIYNNSKLKFQLNNKAGFLPECKLFHFTPAEIAIIIPKFNCWCRNIDSQSIIKSNVLTFHRSSSSHLNQAIHLPLSNHLNSEESIITDENKPDEAYINDNLESNDPDLLKCLQSLFPGSCPIKSCIDRFIWMLNHDTRMQTEVSKDLIYDNTGNKLPIVSCATSISYPVWESINHDAFLLANNSIIQELAWHFGIIIERLGWGAASEGMVILPIYGKLIGFLLVYSIKNSNTALLSIENLSYDSNLDVDQRCFENKLFLSIFENVKLYSKALNRHLEAEFEQRSQMSPQKQPIRIIFSSELDHIDKKYLSEDPGINILCTIDSFFKGFKLQFLLQEHYYFLRFLYQYRLYQYFCIEKNLFKKIGP